MTKRMLVDASHSEETRVVVLDGHRLEEFDLEAANRLPLKGNIYLARVVRVEPSLQAAFVEYGGNRHGFLAFGEIHPDYYQIPVADRQRLLEMQAAEAREAEEAEEAAATRGQRRAPPPARVLPAGEGEQPDIAVPHVSAPEGAETAAPELAAAQPPYTEEPAEQAAPLPGEAFPPAGDPASLPAGDSDTLPGGDPADAPPSEPAAAGISVPYAMPTPAAMALDTAVPSRSARANGHAAADDRTGADEATGTATAFAEDDDPDRAPAAPPPETIGGEGPEDSGDDLGEDGADDPPEEGEGRGERRQSSRYLRHYKIQEVIRRRQVMLIQVVKEERGTKGAALTTFISLAGRFSVLMPNSPRGGGVSRKITSVGDRKRLREAIDEVGLPDGMSLIVRTAGAQRPKPEIRRDCEYLLRLWDSIRERTLASTAPALIYEEADLIKRSIRDVFSRDVEEVLIEGDDAFAQAHEFMRMLMPQNARKIVAYRDGGVPLFARFQVEAQLDAMHSPIVQLRSGGYIVINQTEALVAIDVNSGRATRERHIEDTAFKTNCEAAEEIARQLRLRDLAGLIVVDFIDMESSRNDAAVERRLKDSLRHDKARIQVGRISHFGLLEMSRQRLRPSLAETTFVTCPHCQGRGQVRSVENAALTVLRAIEEEGAKRRAAEICVHVAPTVALYLLNRKRQRLADIEDRFGMAVLFEPDDTLTGAALRIERSRAADPVRTSVEPPAARADGDAAAAEEAGEAAKRKRRRRRRRGGARSDTGAAMAGGEGVDGEGLDGENGDEVDDLAGDAADEATEASPGLAEDVAGRGERHAEADQGRSEPGAEGSAMGSAGESVPGITETGGGGAAGEAGGTERTGSRRSRGRGRGTRPDAGMPAAAAATPAPIVPAAPPARYQGPTPANPFAGQGNDIFAALEAAEAAAEAAANARAVRPVPGPGAEPPVVSVPIQAAPALMPPAAAATLPAPTEAAPADAALVAPAVAEPAEPSVAAEGHAAAPPLAGNGTVTIPATPAATPAAGPVQGPTVQPKLVEAASEAPKRRGWWAR